MAASGQGRLGHASLSGWLEASNQPASGLLSTRLTREIVADPADEGLSVLALRGVQVDEDSANSFHLMKWSVGHEYRNDNPAEQVLAQLPTVQSSQQHQPSLSYRQVGRALAALQSLSVPQVVKLVVPFLVLTAVRLREATEAPWRRLRERHWVPPCPTPAPSSAWRPPTGSCLPTRTRFISASRRCIWRRPSSCPPIRSSSRKCAISSG